MLAVAEHILFEFRRYAYRSAPGDDRPPLKQQLASYVKAVRRNPDITRATVIIYTEALVNKVLEEKLQVVIEQRIDALALDVGEEVAAGRVAAVGEPRAIAAQCFAFLRGALMLHAIDRQFPLERAFQAYADFLFSPDAANRQPDLRAAMKTAGTNLATD